MDRLNCGLEAPASWLRDPATIWSSTILSKASSGYHTSGGCGLNLPREGVVMWKANPRNREMVSGQGAGVGRRDEELVGSR